MLSSIQTKPLHKITRAALPETGRRIDDLYSDQDQTPESVLISFLKTFLQEGGASWLHFIRPVLSLVSSPRLQERSGRRKMALIAVEAVPEGSKPPAADGSMCTSTGGRCGFGASAPSLTGRHQCIFREPSKEVRLSCRSWSRHRPWQNSYTRSSLNLL